MAYYHHSAKQGNSLLGVFLVVFLVSAVFLSLLLVFRGARLPNQAQNPPPPSSAITTVALESDVKAKGTTLLQKISSTQALPADQSLLQLLSSRKQTASQLIDKDPEKFVRTALPEEVRSRLPATAQSFVEQETTLDGYLNVVHYDDFKNKKSKENYFLQGNDGQQYQLYFVGKLYPDISSGTQAKVKGFKLDNKIVVQAYDAKSTENNLQISQIPSVQNKGTTKKIAIFLFNFQNDTSEPWSVDEIRSWTFKDPDSVASYFGENSFGKWTLQGKNRTDGDIFGYYTLPFDSSTGCDSWSWSQAARKQAVAAGADLTGYDVYVYAFKAPSCWFGGWATIGPSFNLGTAETWISGSYINYYGGGAHPKYAVVIHELGHTFGAHHANAYNCIDATGKRAAISNSCQSWEYGDPFDVMGAAWDARQLNNYHKGQLGAMLTPANISTIAQTGTYPISPIEKKTTADQVLRLARGKNWAGKPMYYYIEYRQSSGQYDNFDQSDPVVNGLTIRLAPNFDQHFFQSQLIDTTPDTYSYSDATLSFGKTFADVPWGVTIKAVKGTINQGGSIGGTTGGVAAQITLVKPPCIRAQPTLSLYPIAQWGYSGQTLYYYMSLTNNDTPGCNTVTFTLQPTLFSGWTQRVYPTSITVSPGITTYLTIYVTSSYGTPTGFYTFTETAVHPANSKYNASISANYNVFSYYPPPSSPPVPSP